MKQHHFFKAVSQLRTMTTFHSIVQNAAATSACLFSSLLAFAGPQSGLMTSEFIFEAAPFPSCHASTIAQNTSGSLVTAWFGGTRERHPDVGIWLSRQIDGRWIAPVEVANGIES